MDDAENDTMPDVDGEPGADDAVSNGDLANRRRRQQVRQACQQCRRRKIKVCSEPFPNHRMDEPGSNPKQCDEVRPVCRPCVKARLACAYELPPGQTRAQAMMESQQRLRDELHSHTSLIQSLRCVDANSSIQMLGRLRHGDYDSALLGADLATRSNSPAERVYPWEETFDDSQRQQMRNADVRPQPVDGFPPLRHDSTALYAPPNLAVDKGSHPYDRGVLPGPDFAPNFASHHDMPANTALMNPGNVQDYDQKRLPPFQRPDMQYQPRVSPNYHQGDPQHQSTLPSNDYNRAHGPPR